MQLVPAVALLGVLSPIVDASRCKDRPGHHQSSPLSVPTPLPSVEATQPPTTTTVIMTSSSEPTSSLLPTDGDTDEASSSSSPPTTTSSSAPAVSSTEASSAVSSSPPLSTTSTVTVSTAAAAVPIIDAPAQTQMCSDNQNIILSEWGLVVSNFRVEESDVEGTTCTTYNGMVTLPDGQAAVNFTADANIVFDEATINDNKYYSNAGLGENVPSQLSSISAIPASYSWSRTNTTNFRGNVAFDFVLAPTSGDRTSSATKEIMMWLHWQGDQRPLAWDNGTKATFDLYGRTWDMFQGVNYNLADGAGVELTTITPQQDYGATGSWSGDIMDWLQALVTQGVFTEDYYVTNANAGTEQYWGDSVLESTVALRIDLNT